MTDRDRLIKMIEDGFPTNIAILFRKNIEKTADHLLANGVILLPCKVGDEVYILGSEYVWEATVIRISINTWQRFQEIEIYYVYNGELQWNLISASRIGKEIFLTKEEAEQALKEREKVEN